MAICICVPTYKRKYPAILSLIDMEPNIMFHMFVRKEELEAGFYNESQFIKKNIRLVPLENVHDLGETREAICNWAIEKGFSLCLQIDDTQVGIKDITGECVDLLSVIIKSMEQLSQDENKDKIWAYCYPIKYDINASKYFGCHMCQTFILNLPVLQKYNLHFPSCKNAGVEDESFSCLAADKGLITLSNKNFIKVGRGPSQVGKHISGGTHKENEFQDMLNNARTIIKSEDMPDPLLYTWVINNEEIKDKKYLLYNKGLMTKCNFDNAYAYSKFIGEK